MKYGEAVITKKPSKADEGNDNLYKLKARLFYPVEVPRDFSI
jgi:hypothetical protein